MSLPAGEGEHHIYRISSPGRSGDNQPLTSDLHYVEVTAAAWFINKQGNWLEKLMASGTLEMKLADGLETYQVALGTFELRGDAKTAPVFNEAVLPERNYRGGHLSFNASLTVVKRNTVIADMLKSAASASLGVVAGMVQTATLAGPSKILGAAGDQLISGVKSSLEKGENRQAIFDFSGIKFSLAGGDMTGPELYLLLHRGSALDQSSLSINKIGQLEVPFLSGRLLDDGAWLLLKLTRSAAYHGVREWNDSAATLRFKVKNLVDDFQSGATEKDDALKQLKPGSSANQTLFDEYVRLRTIIQNDGVLTAADRALFVTAIRSTLDEARKAISQGTPTEFVLKLDSIRQNLVSGKPDRAVATNLDHVFRSIVATESTLLPARMKKAKSGSKFSFDKSMNFSRTAKLAFAMPKAAKAAKAGV